MNEVNNISSINNVNNLNNINNFNNISNINSNNQSGNRFNVLVINNFMSDQQTQNNDTNMQSTQNKDINQLEHDNNLLLKQIEGFKTHIFIMSDVNKNLVKRFVLIKHCKVAFI